jgi:hypothetical protein
MVVFADKAAGHEIVLTDIRPKPLWIRSVEVSSAKLRPEVTQEQRDDNGKWVRKIRLQVAGDYPEGRHDEMVHIYTDDPTYAELKVPVTMIKRAAQDLTATPNQVTLTAPPGRPFPARIVLLRAHDDQAVIVDHIMTDDPAIDCRWAPGPNTLATLKIRVDRTRLQGSKLQSAVHIHISKPRPEVVTIPVHSD